MTKVYIAQNAIPELPLSLVFWPNFRFPIKESRLFLRDIMAEYQESFFTVVATPEEADFFAVPFDFFDVLDRFVPYLESVYAEAKALGKKVLLFDYTDYADRVPMLPEHAVLFRVSVYRHHKRRNEIIMPYFVEDVGKRYGIGPEPVGREPSVGFCGQSDFASFGKQMRATLKLILSRILLIVRLDKKPSVHMRGIFWRRRALGVLRKSQLPSDFITRRFYSLHQKSGSFNPKEVRQEYVENLRRNLFSLCVRGDANASQRFFETLSASRVPLFLDTDCVLPLEERVHYDRLMLRVPWQRFRELPELLRVFTEKRSPAEMERIEREARVVYDEYLRMDRFFSIVFDREKSPHREILFAP